MDETLKQALQIVKAQAGVRVMNVDDVVEFLGTLTRGLQAAQTGEAAASSESAVSPFGDPKKSIKETTITCLECGEKMKMISPHHLAQHGLDAKSYKEKWGLKKSVSLSCKALTRQRRERMESMRLWERKGKKSGGEYSTTG
ncbi:MAG: MucR family transcriptional regulator [Desulfovibrio sp.]|jgi:predicted transcriptional regulator|nr:MucR family transcriptional regulator [Desulfovibrio sp.]